MNTPEFIDTGSHMRVVWQRPPTCDELREYLFAYLDCELCPQSEVALLAHLEECVTCSDAAKIERELRALVQRCCDERAPETLRLKIHSQIEVTRES